MVKQFIFLDGMLTVVAKNETELIEKLCSIENELETLLDKLENRVDDHSTKDLKQNAPKISKFIEKL